MNIMQKIFGNATNPGVNPAALNPATMAANPAAAQGPAGHNPALELQGKSDATTAPNGIVPATSAAATADGKNGLEQFNDMWTATAPAGQGQGQPLFNLSQENILAAARKQDFTKEIATPEMLAKVAAGGAEGVQAMMEMMNSMGQMVYAQSAVATTKLVEGALDKSNFAKIADLDTHMKRHTLNTTLPDVNPVFSSPAAQPIIQGLSQQFMVKFPAASPKEISGMVNDYLTNFSNAFNAPAKAAEQQKQQAASGETDWSKFMN